MTHYERVAIEARIQWMEAEAEAIAASPFYGDLIFSYLPRR